MLDEINEDKSGEEFIQDKKATIVFKNVKFSYDKKNPVIYDFSLTVPSGKKVTLVGATGSGKTTIINLLMRFYDIDSGEIFINDQPIKNISRTSLRQNIAIVLQDAILFSNTVRENLKYGNKDATEQQLENAVEMSRCKDMLQKLSQG